MRRIAPRALLLVAASPLALMANAAHADTVQISGTFDVEQNIAFFANAAFYHENQGEGDPLQEGYIFFDEYTRVMNEEITVWDPSQIATSPELAEGNVVSEAQLNGTWTFDASFLNNINTSIELHNAEQSLGGSSDVSIFTVEVDGAQVDGGIGVQSNVFAINNALVGEGGETLDLMVVQSLFPPEPNEDNSGALFYMGFEDTWFEDYAAGNVANLQEFFEGQVVSTVELTNLVFYESNGVLPTGVQINAGDLMADVSIFSDVQANDLSIGLFGAADGSSEDAPLLPVAATVEENATTPTFSFDVSGAGTDIIFIDPEIAVGYTYAVEGEGVITAFVAPSADAVAVPVGFTGYTVTVVGGNLDGQVFTVLPADPNDIAANTLNFAAADAVRELVLEGIWIDNAIEPGDFSTFVAGFGFSGATQGTSISQTALVIDTDAISPVPLPAGLVLMLTGLGGLLFARRRTSC